VKLKITNGGTARFAPSNAMMAKDEKDHKPRDAKTTTIDTECHQIPPSDTGTPLKHRRK